MCLTYQDSLKSQDTQFYVNLKSSEGKCSYKWGFLWLFKVRALKSGGPV